MADIPHFALPFRFENGRAVVNEQDSVEDVAACVEAVLRTRPGERDDLPTFGVPDPTFSQAPLSTDALVRQVQAWEPRAEILATDHPDALDAAIQRVQLDVSTQE